MKLLSLLIVAGLILSCRHAFMSEPEIDIIKKSWQARLEVADQSVDIYHQIYETSERELENSNVVREITQKISSVRESYKMAGSYDKTGMPPWQPILLPGKQRIPFRKYKNLLVKESLDSTTIYSSRGKEVVQVSVENGNWDWKMPFKMIVENNGDDLGKLIRIIKEVGVN